MLIFDYPEHIGTRAARFRYHDGFSRDPSGQEIGDYRGPNLTVCDSYSKTTRLEEMKNDQLAKLDTYGGLDKDHFFLLSWTLTPDIHTALDPTGSVEKDRKSTRLNSSH